MDNTDYLEPAHGVHREGRSNLECKEYGLRSTKSNNNTAT